MPLTDPRAPKPKSADLVERNRTASEQLASRYDLLNEQFIAAESRLKALKPLRPTWVSYDHQENEDGFSFWELLGLAKVDGKWRLVHASDHELNDDGSGPLNIKPVTECTVEVRISAAKQVRNLHEKIVEQKEKFIPTVEEAIAELKSYCAEV